MQDMCYSKFLEWTPFDRFEDIKQIGEGGFSNPETLPSYWIKDDFFQ